MEYTSGQDFFMAEFAVNRIQVISATFYKFIKSAEKLLIKSKMVGLFICLSTVISAVSTTARKIIPLQNS